MGERVKNSVGIWAFSDMPTRFLSAGYHPEAKNEEMVERTKRVVEGLGDLVNGYEYHYPGEINERNVEAIQRALGEHDIYCVASGLHTDPRHALGAFTNPKEETRRNAIRLTRAAIDLAADVGAKFIIWPGIEGYNYPFQVDYQDVWSRLIDGIQAAVEHANKKSVTVLLEHKNSEPAMKVLMRNIGMTMFIISKLKAMGTDVTNVKVNMDWQHLIMNGEHLAEYAALLASEGLLGHQHANSGWGIFDDDNMVGATYFMAALEMAKVLQKVGYGNRGERVGFDLFPYTEDPIEATKQSVLQWEFIWHLAQNIDDELLAEAQQANDAVRAYQIVYAALGLNQELINKIYASRKEQT